MVPIVFVRTEINNVVRDINETTFQWYWLRSRTAFKAFQQRDPFYMFTQSNKSVWTLRGKTVHENSHR